MKIALIVILALAIFMFISTRNSKSKEEWAVKSLASEYLYKQSLHQTKEAAQHNKIN